MTSCATPLSDGTIIDWIDGRLDAADAEQAEEHLFGCDFCTKTAETYARIVTAMRSYTPPVIDSAGLRLLESRGHPMKQNPMVPGQRVEISFGSDVFLIHRLGGLDLEGVSRVDVGFGPGDEPVAVLPDSPFDPATGEVIIACQTHFYLRFPPEVVFTVTTPEPDETPRVLGRYRVLHRP